MSRGLFSYTLLRGISDEARQVRILTSPHQRLPASEIQAMSLHLPEVRTPAQFLIDMGLSPALARRLSTIYMDIVSRCRQVFEAYFRRASCYIRPEYYRDLFVVQFKGIIQVLGSQITSSAWVWLCRDGLPLTPSCPQQIDVRVDKATKAQILLRLRPRAASPIMNESTNTIELPEDECKTEVDSSVRMLPASPPPPLKSSNPPIHDPFSPESSPTCFPAHYPPPPGESDTLPRRALVTSFARAAFVQTEKPSRNCSADMLPLISLFDLMGLSSQARTQRIQGTPKGLPRNSKLKTDPLPPPVSPNAVDTSSPHCEAQPSLVPATKATPVTRRRRIAPLPTRHIKSAVSSPSNTPRSLNTPPDVNASSGVSCLLSTSHTQDIAKSSSPPMSRSVVSKQRKTIPLLRRAPFPSQITSSSQQESQFSSLLGWNVTSRPVSRTPSLLSDTSSGIESASSSDELDTPPSTPPPSLHVLSVHGTVAEGTATSLKPNVLVPLRRSSLGDGALSNASEQGVRIDLTKGGDCRQGRPLTFTFSA